MATELNELSGGTPLRESQPVTIASPVKPSERILNLDILRGMALFGILAANMRGFSAPMLVYFDIHKWFQSRPDYIAQAFIDIFIQRKFVTLFSVMFGMGFALQMSRAERQGSRFLSFYPRRLAALALFGLIHGLAIWSGDILLTYALAGALLLLFRNRSQKGLLVLAASIWGGGTAALIGFTLAVLLKLRPPPKPDAIDMDKVAHLIQVYAGGTLSQIMAANWLQWRNELVGFMFIPFAASLFMLGMWIYREGILEKPEAFLRGLKRVCVICLPVGLLINILHENLLLRYPSAPRPPLIGLAIRSLDIWSGLILAAGYASGLLLLLQRPAWKAKLSPFAAVGRTALTNYLAQSIICVTFFRLTHLYGVWGPAWDLAPTIVLFSVQIVLSNWWLRHFRFGPMEWVWRGLTYGRWPEMRRVR